MVDRRPFKRSPLNQLPPVLAAIAFLCLPVCAQTINIKQSINATPGIGGKLQVGQTGRTGSGGLLIGSFPWGGVKALSVFPRSSIKLREYGFSGNGGRSTTLDVSGEVYVTVLTSNPNSRVKVCFKNFIGLSGCSLLRSSVRVKDDLIAVREGEVTAQDELEKTPPQTVRSGQYSILLASGAFSAPYPIFGQRGYRLKRRLSKTVGLFEAFSGWLFTSGDRTVQGAIGTDWQVISPLGQEPPDLP